MPRSHAAGSWAAWRAQLVFWGHGNTAAGLLCLGVCTTGLATSDVQFPLSFNRASTWPREPARATRPTAELLCRATAVSSCLLLSPLSESDVRNQPSHPQMQGRDKDLTITPLFGPSMFHLCYRKLLQAQKQDLSTEKAAEPS